VLALAAAAAAQSWRVLPGAPLAVIRHEDVFFVDPLHGWVVNLRGEVHRTRDGGASWQSASIPNVLLRSVVFADTLRGWAGALRARPHALYATTDGGATWAPVPDIQGPPPGGVCGLWQVGQSVTVGVGTYDGWPRFLRSRDGGTTWTSTDMSPWARTLVDCYFVAPDSGFVVGGQDSVLSQARAVVLWTGDGGASWERRHLGSQIGQWAWKIAFPTRDVGYVSLESIQNLPIFLKTTDGGLHWSEAAFVASRQQGVGFANDRLGWIGGGAHTYRTPDGGATWVQDDFGTEINSFHMLSDVLGYAVGRSVYKFAPPTAVAVRSVAAVKDLYR
jgi:photosystem II stability/assembly factor-like uncharacterized protein